MREQAWRKSAQWLVLGLVLATGVAQAGQKQVGGVRMPDSMTLQGRTVELAHMELHKRFIFKVYVWSLYLEDRPRSASEAIASNSVKRLHFRFLRDITRSQLVDSLRNGLNRSAELREGPLSQQLGVMLDSMRDVEKGGDLIITYTPGGGLEIGGAASGGVFIPGKTFADALFSVWLDVHPIFPR
ncbi:chalcone isomerase family protein [Myxococcus sp. CA051A]|uniref:Chalcone isomerase domain-containing protein n=2 Tax=Myxococcus TaxID=32 RepID=A0A540X7U8_9BACT|nr:MULTISPECIES: chalcone isomerase family protein [Myxococcus]NTX54836.1 chalcone isomerase family protein [Myxococcus sp. CA039A]NTX06328.1 chalcone isomerase family protein [Myxococcus sp. CA040A]NTX09586.1 chalcone isomerase family protein [Myxococcus sp. CA056]NTX34950.1 chalcone isomerase family protein [Myxococcus sp. CA033]NTX64927.1 chalcone isomerase family protein [Myxococcus sp. CA051A]